MELEQPAAAVANEYFVGAINRVGIEPLGDNDFYGQTYFADPRGQLVGRRSADDSDESSSVTWTWTSSPRSGTVAVLP